MELVSPNLLPLACIRDARIPPEVWGSKLSSWLPAITTLCLCGSWKNIWLDYDWKNIWLQLVSLCGPTVSRNKTIDVWYLVTLIRNVIRNCPHQTLQILHVSPSPAKHWTRAPPTKLRLWWSLRREQRRLHQEQDSSCARWESECQTCRQTWAVKTRLSRCLGLCCVICRIPCLLQEESQDDWLGVSSHEQSSSIASSSLLVWNSTHEESAPLLYSCVQLWLAALLLDWVFRREDCWLNSQRHHLDVLNKVDCVTSPWQCVNLGRRFQYRYWLVIDIRNKQKERRNWSRWQCQTPISWSILVMAEENSLWELNVDSFQLSF